MKKYDQDNYSKYKNDVNFSIKNLKGKRWDEYTRDELIIKFCPLVENLARKFSTSHQATGVMSISDLIQFGHLGLIKAVDKIAWKTIYEAKDPEKRLKSFLAKRIKGSIRRGIDNTRGTMRIPEHKLNEIRKSKEENKGLLYNSVFTSVEDMIKDTEGLSYDIPDISDEIDYESLSNFLVKTLDEKLTAKEASIIKLSYGLNCEKHSAKEIATILNIKGDSAYVRISQLKRQAIDKLKATLDHSQVIDYL
jgi:RNA polymerase sigma factor (sigma-70 family)